ncbi:hypothetical protein [Lentzea californiensis]|uniref:hypothetical protein n=1 Tax=Lentzea californiensis TaxID=438851 RepID=UPI0021665A71|nr:hypothetical protein [Lentzea californiensis]MCR3752243.1 hypothetical protein [Lentzea californiensis]
MLLVGCSTNGAAPPRPIPPEATAPDAVNLPLDQYRLSTWDTGRIILAREILIHRCIEDRGGSKPSPDAAAIEQDARVRIKDIGPRGNKRRYGITDPRDAAVYGYHLPSTVDRTERPVPAKERSTSSQCVQQADKTLGEANLTTPAEVKEISTDSYERSLSDPRVAQARTQWSACMKAAGHDYDSSAAAAGAFDLSAATVTAAEIATASADVECKSRSGLVGTWQEVESAIQQSVLDSRRQAFQDIAEQRERFNGRADRTINGH